MEKNQEHAHARQPERKFRAGGVTATIWKNAATDEKGQARDFHSIAFEKGYKDKAGSWKSTNSLSVTDLPKAIVVLSKAYEFLTLKGASVEIVEAA